MEDIIPARKKDNEAPLKARLKKLEDRVMLLDKPVVQKITSREEDEEDIGFVDLEEYEEVMSAPQVQQPVHAISFNPKDAKPPHIVVP